MLAVGACCACWGNLPDGRPQPVSSRHLCDYFNLAIPDSLLSLGGQSRASDGVDDVAGCSVAVDGAGSKRICRSASSISCQVKGIAVQDVGVSNVGCVYSQGGDDM